MNEPVFQRKALYAAVCAALASPLAIAPAVGHAATLPGQGQVVAGYANNTTPSSTTGQNIQVGASGGDSGVIIQWGGGTTGATINSSGTPGFNIGSAGTVTFVNQTATGTGKATAVLNIDVSGNPSSIDGTLAMTATGGATPVPLYVANANGIMVGGNAVINAPAGLGLVNADLSSSNAQAVFEQSGNPLPISFEGATGGVSIAGGYTTGANPADLSNVGNFLLVAGAGSVNITGGHIGTSGSAEAIPGNLNVVAGIGGYWTGTTLSGSFYPQDQGAGQTFGSLSTSNYDSRGDFSYQDAATSVSLNLGTTSAPYDGSSLSVYADGAVNNNGHLTDLQGASFNWLNGTFTNNGTLDYGNQGASGSLQVTTSSATLGYTGNNSDLYGNTTMAVGAGDFVNASGAIINAGGYDGFSAFVASFSNAGTIQLGQAYTDEGPQLYITASSGDINLGGTVDVVSAGSYTGALGLSYLSLYAEATYGQTINVNTPLTVLGQTYPALANFVATNVNINQPLNVSAVNTTDDDNNASVYIGAKNVSINAPISISATETADVIASDAGEEPDVYSSFTFSPMPGTSGTFDVTSNGSITANYLWMGTENSSNFNFTGTGPALTQFTIDGALVATHYGSVSFGGSSTSAPPQTGDVSGSGSITAGYLWFNNLVGSVNNIHTSQILANGFQINAPSSGPVNIYVLADGSGSQGFNLAVNGDANLYSDTPAADYQLAPGGSNDLYQQPANANSNFVVQASGLVRINGTYYGDSFVGVQNSTSYGYEFQWPGLIYVRGDQGVRVNTTIDNAYTVSGQTGAVGVFLIGPSITDHNPIYTNGSAGVVFADTDYGYTTVNSQPQGAGMPMVYFATGTDPQFYFAPTTFFTNSSGYLQEMQTFYTLNPGQQPQNAGHNQ